LDYRRGPSLADYYHRGGWILSRILYGVPLGGGGPDEPGDGSTAMSDKPTWKQRHPERAKALNRKYHREHREEEKKYREEKRSELSARTKRWADKNPEKRKITYKKYSSLNPEKIKAKNALNNSIISGIIVRPDTCPCGNPNPEGHHPDYSKPLMVMWLCRRCHAALHAKEKENNNA
jgi:hypothetical protein